MERTGSNAHGKQVFRLMVSTICLYPLASKRSLLRKTTTIYADHSAAGTTEA